MQDTSADVVKCNQKLFKTVLRNIPREYMHKMTTRISGINDTHMNFTVKDFRHFGNDQSFGRITVTLYPQEAKVHGHCGSVIVSTWNGNVTIKDGFHLVIIFGHDKHVAIGELWKVLEDELNRKNDLILVKYSIQSEGTALYVLEKMKTAICSTRPLAKNALVRQSWKLLNTSLYTKEHSMTLTRCHWMPTDCRYHQAHRVHPLHPCGV